MKWKKKVNDIEDKLMARKETEEKKRKTIKDHEERLREINDSLRRKTSMFNWDSRGCQKGQRTR